MNRIGLGESSVEGDLGAIAQNHLQKRWTLLLGGITKDGHARAARACASALRKRPVVWFDGFPDGATADFDPEGEDLTLIEYGDAESGTLAARLALEQTVLSGHEVGRWISKTFARRLGSLLRPQANWSLLRPALQSLAPAVPPEEILYCDDYVIPTAWHAARIWTSAPVGAVAAGR